MAPRTIALFRRLTAGRGPALRFPTRAAVAPLAGAGLILGITASGVGQVRADELPLIDAHSQVAPSVGMDRVLSLMDRAGIARAILSFVGDPKKPVSDEARKDKIAELVSFARNHPDRITPSIALKMFALFHGEPSALETVRRLSRQPAFGAMSELLVWHAAKASKAPEVVIRMDSPQVSEVLAIAISRNWPFVIHIEFGAAAQSASYGEYMTGLERLLDQHPDHPMVLSHMGQLTSREVRRLIEAHGNIYFLTSHANTDWIRNRGGEQPWIDLFRGAAFAPDWRALMVAHPDRFIFALDNVYDGDWGDGYIRQARLFRTALADLPAAVAHAIAHGNAERLWRLPALAPAAADRSQPPAPGQPAPLPRRSDANGEVVGPRGLTARQVIQDNDADGDGRLRANEFRGPPHRFGRIDGDGDGFVTAAELEAFWRQLVGRDEPRTGAGARAATNEAGVLPDAAQALLSRLVGSDFGAVTNIDGRPRHSGRHNAVDIRGKVGDEVLAAADGRVEFAGETQRGLAVVLGHGRNLDGFWYSTRYQHNSENLVSVGETVKRGQVIARLGNSGTSDSSPHVHFQVDRSPSPTPAGDQPTDALNPRLYWDTEHICFDPDAPYQKLPIRFTLPVRCPR